MAKLSQLEKVFRGKGFNPVIGDIYMQQEKWINWFRGNVNEFHYYSVKNAQGLNRTYQKKAMNMAKKIGEDWSGLLFNEDTMLTTNNDRADEVLNRIVDRLALKDEIPTFIEYVMGGYGTGVAVEYVSEGEVDVDFIYGDKVVVLSANNTQILEIATIQEFQQNKDYYTHVTYHTFNKGVYRIEHEVYSAKQKAYLGGKTDITVVFSEEEAESMMHVERNEDGAIMGIRYYKEYVAEQPFFQVFKPALANNFETNSPFGIPTTANSISMLESIDNELDGYDNEAETAKRKIIFNSEVVKTQLVKERSGENQEVTIRAVNYIDTNNPMYQAAPMGAEIPFKEFSPVYNADPYINSMKFKCAMIGWKAGLGTGYYSFDMAKGVTATEVISRASDTWKNRGKHLKRLERVLINMMKSIMFLEHSVGGYLGSLDLKYEVMFDDSIFVDDERDLEIMKQDAQSGFIPMWRYVAKRYKLSDEEAKAWVIESKGDDDLSALMGIEAVDDEDEDEATTD